MLVIGSYPLTSRNVEWREASPIDSPLTEAIHHYAKNFFESSLYEIVGTKHLKHVHFGFGNGLFNEQIKSQLNGSWISQLAGGVNVCCIFNRLQVSASNLLRYLAEACGACTLPSKLYRLQWRYMKDVCPDRVFVQVCHSWGALLAHNALKEIVQEGGSMAEWAKRKLIIVAIAPARLIPREMCLDAFNLVSKADWFIRPIQCLSGRKADRMLLEKAEGAPAFDHACMSPTFAEPLRHIFSRIIKTYEIDQPLILSQRNVVAQGFSLLSACKSNREVSKDIVRNEENPVYGAIGSYGLFLQRLGMDFMREFRLCFR